MTLIRYAVTAVTAAAITAAGLVGFAHPTPVIHTVTVTDTVTNTVTPPACLTALALADRSFTLLSDTLHQVVVFDTAFAANDLPTAEAATAQIGANTAQMRVSDYRAARTECQATFKEST